MSLALWEFNWSWGGSAPPVSVSVSAITLIAAGPGGGATRLFDYHPLPDEYWEAREGRMTQDQAKPTVLVEVPTTPSPAPRANSGLDEGQRRELVASLANASDLDHFKSIAAKIRGA